jgi:uncharacterized protein YjlB
MVGTDRRAVRLIRRAGGRALPKRWLSIYEMAYKAISLLPRPAAALLALYFAEIPLMTEQQDFVQPEQFDFKDDGNFPNSALPLLLYRQAITTEAREPASIFEKRFAENDWTNSWRNGVYSFPHYHSTSHEVLGVYSGAATLRLGGEHGKSVEVHAGDVIVIPAGVAHQNIGGSDDFGVVGAYPGGREWDLLRGLPGERPKADQNIAALPMPDNDPIYGAEGPLRQIWKSGGAKSK